MRDSKYYSPTDLGISAKAATGASTSLFCRDFRNAVFSIGTASSANMTIKVYGGIGNTAPTFTSAASATNRWTPIDLAPLNNAGVIVDGDTGLVWAGTDANYIVEVNANALDWIALVITARSAGTVTADCLLTDNE